MLHELIKAYQKSRGLSLEKLGAEIGISPSATWRLLHQKPLSDKYFRSVIRWILAGNSDHNK